MESEPLLKLGSGSAEGSTRQRARVCRGRRGGRTSRACKAERRAEDWAREGSGEGRRIMSIGSRSSMSSSDSDTVDFGTARED